MTTLAAAVLGVPVTPGDAAVWYRFSDRAAVLVQSRCGVLDEVSRYALDRLLSAHRLWDPAGRPSTAVLGASLDRFGVLGPDDRVRYALEVEYGRVLPSLESSCFVVRSVSALQLVLPAAEHAAAASERFAALDLLRPVALVVPSRGRLKVVDGYHRSGAALSTGSPDLLVVHALQ